MVKTVERPHSTPLSQDKIGLSYREIRTAEGFIDPRAILLNFEDDIRHGIFPLGDPETGQIDERDMVPFEQRRLEEWGGKFQNGLLVPNSDLKRHQGIIGNTIQEIAINVAVGLAQKGILERVVNLGTLLTLRENPDYESARKAFALADTIARAVAVTEVGPNPSMPALERVKAKYAPFHAFLAARRMDAIPYRLFPEEEIDRANEVERMAIEENGRFIAQRVAAIKLK